MRGIPLTIMFLSTGVASAGDVSFTDVTDQAGVNVTHDASGFDRSSYAGGGTVGDFNNDGWQDLFILSGGDGNQPDHLFINNGNGTFTDRALEWGLTAAHKGKSACVGDYDGDGWQDLFVTSAGPWNQSAQVGHHKLYHNNGDGTFTNVATTAGVATTNPTYPDAWTACFGDYDLDGDLDLYVGGFVLSDSSNEGKRLFRNNDNGTFSDVTQQIGLFSGVGPIANLSSRFIDMDGDHYPELLLVGDFQGVNGHVGSRYFKNNTNGTFTDMTRASDTGDEENGMGHCVGDFDNDGLMDWYVTSIFFPAIGWTGNKLYRNLGSHDFVEGSESAGCNDGGYGWGAVAVDFDHDGFLDIAETNGDGSSSGSFSDEQSYLFMSDGRSGSFTENALDSGVNHTGPGRSLLNLDYDNDGDQDLLIIANGEPVRLYRNNITDEPNTNWLRVFLEDGGVHGIAPSGYGTKVRVTVGSTSMTRSIDGGTTFLGICELSAHFGLGSATVVDALRVEWPHGSVTELFDIAVNQTLTINAGATPCPADLDGDGLVNGADLGLLLIGWNAGGLSDINGDGTTNGADMGLMLIGWGDCG